MPDRFCMMFRTGNREINLRYSHKEMNVLLNLRKAPFPEGERFIVATEMFASFSVAKGKNTKACVEKPRKTILRAAEALLLGAKRERDMLSRHNAEWEAKIIPIIQFLKKSRAKKVCLLSRICGSFAARASLQAYETEELA